MSTFTQHAFIHGKFSGSMERGWQKVHEILTQPFPHAMFCPVCADIWARFPIEGTDKRFTVVTRTCKKCGPNDFELSPAGSLTLSWNDFYSDVDYWSDAMLQWEFEIWMKLMESEG